MVNEIAFITTNIIAYGTGVFAQNVLVPPTVVFLLLSAYAAVQGPALYVANWASLMRFIAQVIAAFLIGFAGVVLTDRAIKIRKFIMFRGGELYLTVSSIVEIGLLAASMVIFEFYGMSLGLLGSAVAITFSVLAFWGINVLAINMRETANRKAQRNGTLEEDEESRQIIPTPRVLIEFCLLLLGAAVLIHILQFFVLLPAFSSYPQEITAAIQIAAIWIMTLVFYFVYNRNGIMEKSRKIKDDLEYALEEKRERRRKQKESQEDDRDYE